MGASRAHLCLKIGSPHLAEIQGLINDLLNRKHENEKEQIVYLNING